MAVHKSGKRWRAEVWHKGKRSESRYFDRKAEAVLWEAKTKEELRSGQKSVEATLTVKDLLIRYRDTVSPTKKGHKWESVRLDLIMRDEIATVLLVELAPLHVAEWRDRRLETVSGSTVNREMNILAHAFRTASDEWGWLKSVPTRKVRRPKEDKARDRRITQEEIDEIRFIFEFPHEEIEIKQKKQEVCVAFLFAIETAMRMGEICSLKRENIKGSVAYLCETKNGHARRVPLSKYALQLLDVMPNSEGLIWNINATQMSSLFRKYRAMTSIEDLVFHDTRHEAITRLASKLKVLDLARMTGHRDINQLQIYYNERPEDIANKLG